jgi:hypothetical protein
MNRPGHIIVSLLIAWYYNTPCLVEATQLIKLTTTSATFDLVLGIDNDNSDGHDILSTNYEQFIFESSMSKLFHTKLSKYYADSRDIDFSRSRVVATSVHIEHMMPTTSKVTNNATTTEKKNTPTSAYVLFKSVVSVTFSDVGLYKALKAAPITGGLEAKLAPDVASHLTEIISSADLMRVLIDEELIASNDNSTEIELSFVKFDGSLDERGMTATETEILSSGKNNDGWPMFFAGMMFAFLMVSIATVAAWVYKKEFPFVFAGGNTCDVEEEDAAACKSVHYKEGDADDVATTASGILGTKGMHPRATTFEENDENAHPNNGGGSAYRRRKRYGNSSSSSQTEDDTEVGSPRDDAGCCSPRTPLGAAMSSRRFPLGITSMRRLDSIRTPQKVDGDRRPSMYDIDRLTRS